MSHYRDHIEAAQARIETLEAKLMERDAALTARDAELAEIRAEVARLRGGRSSSPAAFAGASGASGQRALLAAVAMCGFATAAAYAMVRPECHSAYRTTRHLAMAPPDDVTSWVVPDDVAQALRTQPARNERKFDARAAVRAIEDASRRAKECKRPGGPVGEGEVTLILQPDGSLSIAEVSEPPYAGTDVGECVANTFFRTVSVPPYDGEPLTVVRRFSIE
jgi:hypothetical protein